MSPAPRSPCSIVYVTSRWGEPSQTFVRREASAVRDLGVEVTAASIKTPRPCEPAVETLWLRWYQVVVFAFVAAVRHPGRASSLIA